MITKELPQPVGIVVFGADCDLKDEVYMECVERIPNFATGYGGKGDSMPLRAAMQPLSEGRSVITMMHGDSSGVPRERNEVVAALRRLGAKSVVGIYTKTEARTDNCENVADFHTLCTQCQRLANHPPTTEGLDLFLIRTGEKEG